MSGGERGQKPSNVVIQVNRKEAPGAPASGRRSKWSARYGDRNRFSPIEDNPLLPNSRRGKVKIWQRGPHEGAGPHRFVLEWREGGRTLKQTVVGDLLMAATQANAINERLCVVGRSGKICSAISISELVRRYIARQNQRADAQEIRPESVARYRTALQKLIDYTQIRPGRTGARAAGIDTEFVLDFKTYLRTVLVRPNGHPSSEPRPMTEAGRRYVISAAAAAWNWAAQEDPPWIPAGVQNPFKRHVPPRPSQSLVKQEPFASVQVVRLIEQCDAYRLSLLAPMALYGLRAAEPCWVMIEDWDRVSQSVAVICQKGIEHRTKGDADKRLPVPPALEPLLRLIAGAREGGPLFVRRAVFEGLETTELERPGIKRLAVEYQRRVAGVQAASERQRIRRGLMSDAGAATYDQINAEFRQVAQAVGLGREWTLKSLRHHFASHLEKSNVAYFTRKYLMGHQMPRDPLGEYTRISFDDVREQYEHFLSDRFAPIAQAIAERSDALGLGPSRAS